MTSASRIFPYCGATEVIEDHETDSVVRLIGPLSSRRTRMQTSKRRIPHTLFWLQCGSVAAAHGARPLDEVKHEVQSKLGVRLAKRTE